MLTWIAASAAALLVFGGGLFVWRRRQTPTSGRDDRYTPERLLTPEQVQMLDYLHDTFPGQVVLPNLRLQDMLSVRKTTNRKRAEERLQQFRVDFAVFGEDGRPMFAFDIEQFHLSNAKAKEHMLKVKNRILKTAGVRFVFLKNGIHRMPSPADFRRQLNLAELPPPRAVEEPRESARQQLESQFSEFEQTQSQTHGFRDSEVMGLSGLMNLNNEDMFEQMARQRPPTGRRRA